VPPACARDPPVRRRSAGAAVEAHPGQPGRDRGHRRAAPLTFLRADLGDIQPGMPGFRADLLQDRRGQIGGVVTEEYRSSRALVVTSGWKVASYRLRAATARRGAPARARGSASASAAAAGSTTQPASPTR